MSKQAAPSDWEIERFGELAPAVRAAVWRALQAAHRRALAGHLGFGLDTNDVYGQLWLIQNEELAKALEEVTEVRRSKPKRARYELTIIGANNIILYPWRFSDDAYSPVTSARMSLSKTREQLLALTPAVSDQLSLDQAELSEEELAAEFQDLESFLDDAARAGRMVIIAYASNPHAGVLRAYWGDASQADGNGRLNWSHMEPIPPVSEIGESSTSGAAPVRPAGPATGAVARFDQAPMDEILLSPRNPATVPDGGQPPTPQPETGSDD
ncbi:hypothetical protein AB0H00_30790 [Nocardia sp. NPDC023852]|uniref:hypothetical protein n=1 Tax=Nocardia sp. NPDC023852 TaxID=3154697 RepID=UPI0033F8B188